MPIRLEIASIAAAVHSHGHGLHMLWIDPFAGQLWSYADEYRRDVTAQPLSSARLTLAGISTDQTIAAAARSAAWTADIWPSSAERQQLAKLTTLGGTP